MAPEVEEKIPGERDPPYFAILLPYVTASLISR